MAPVARREPDLHGSTLGWLLLAAGIGLVVIACLIGGGGGAGAGLAGVTGLLTVATSFGVRNGAKTYPGVRLDRNQPATTNTPHRIFVR
ncbi:hypothetical protein [Streptomyces sp. LS1784]|uniref:hypothetical protein n=1 Tax=Streptomyces sp. LS1784 TaxID=2851533 RepID=UPI001CC91E42|nr:hypothetical protein [Streptomyces sp. LS1784]